MQGDSDCCPPRRSPGRLPEVVGVDDELGTLGASRPQATFRGGGGGHRPSERAWGTVREDYSSGGDAWVLLSLRARRLEGVSVERGRHGRHLR